MGPEKQEKQRKKNGRCINKQKRGKKGWGGALIFWEKKGS